VTPRTKLICTIGPASASGNVIRAMMRSGMDVVRLNCSHGTHEAMRGYIKAVRALNRKYRRRLRILLDLEGPRIRVGRLEGRRPIELRRGQVLWLAKGDFRGSGSTVPIDYQGPLSDLRPARHIFIDDGNICLAVRGVEKNRVRTRVVCGGLLKEHKGINVPGVHLSIPDVTKKDIRDIRFGVREGVDMIAQSFVRSAEPMAQIRDLVQPQLSSCALVAKIENEEGVENLAAIIGASDGIMVARGDLGVSLHMGEVPVIEKRIIKAGKRRGRFVITATQMLESMVEHLRPTRAEVSDIANAILDGTNYVMLSAETAVGSHPVEAVKMMNDVIKHTERSEFFRKGS